MQRRLRQVFCALKEHSSVSYAKIATVGGFCDITLIVVKATSPDDLPLADKYIHQLLRIFTLSPSSCHSFALSLSSRFSKTRSWRVGLKCLLLLHRLLRCLPECSPFRTELLWTKSNGLLSLYPCHFRDESSSNPECYTMFIRSYAQLLDEALECFFFEGIKVTEVDQEGEDQQKEVTCKNKMEEVGRLLQVLPQLQNLIDRVMDCRPTGAAGRSFIVQSAMKYIIRDSFICYTTFRREVILVLDNLIQMPYRSCVLAFGIYKKAALQADHLCEFYDWCRARVLCGAYEYPYIDKIPQIQIRALETFLNGMWQITEPSSSTTSPSSWMETKSSSTEDDGDNRRLVVRRDYVISTEWEKFEENSFTKKVERNDHDHDMAPLIQFEDEEEDDWEALLDASLNHIPRNKMMMMMTMYSNGLNNGYGSDSVCGKETEEVKNQWQIQLYHSPNNALNPFCEPCYVPVSNASFVSTPATSRSTSF